MDYLIAFQKKYQREIDIYIDCADNFIDIFNKILLNCNINLEHYNYDLILRSTNTGYKMKYHRDNYMLRKFKTKYVFIPFNDSKTPRFSLLWYKNDDFTGGSLQFLSGKVIKPKKNMFIFFDSNDIHRVNEQLSGKRIVQIYKFYKK